MTSSETLPLSEDQQALQDTLRGFLADQFPPAALRAALETQAGYSPELHARLAGELGLAGLTIPQEFGGLGRSQAEASVVHTELGRVLYPGPFLSTDAGRRHAARSRRPRGAGAVATAAGRRVGDQRRSRPPARTAAGCSARTASAPNEHLGAGGSTATGGTS